jgi:hypothetical protein
MAWVRIGVFPNEIEANHYCQINGYAQFDRNFRKSSDGRVEVFILNQALDSDDGRTRFTGIDNRGEWS